VSATPETVPNTPENVLEAPIASPEQVAKAVDAILETAPTPDQAAYLATNAQVLAVVSTTQAEEIFEALDVTELDDTQVAALIEAVQDAPQEIRETFEENVDIFKAGLDTYVPVGSNIPVGARRTLVAIGAVLTMLPPPTRIRP
jgi:glycyl-tRNA synthetase beta subunit